MIYLHGKHNCWAKLITERNTPWHQQHSSFIDTFNTENWVTLLNWSIFSISYPSLVAQSKHHIPDKIVNTSWIKMFRNPLQWGVSIASGFNKRKSVGGSLSPLYRLSLKHLSFLFWPFNSIQNIKRIKRVLKISDDSHSYYS